MPITAIKSVLLFDGNDVQQDVTVTFDAETGNILSVSKSSGPVPQGAKVIDGSGHTLLPGLIDAHVHAYSLHLPPGADSSKILVTPLQTGVTTICDMHSDPDVIIGFKEKIRQEVTKLRAEGGAGKVTMTDLKSCLLGATIAGGWPKAIVLASEPSEEVKNKVANWPSLTTENAAEYIKDHIDNGADYIKLMQENCACLKLPTNSIPVATPELQSSVVKAAHASNLLVVGHATSIESTEIILRAGVDGTTHTFMDQAPTKEIVDLHKEKEVFVIPILVVLSSMSGEEQEERNRFAAISEKLGLIDDFTKENMVSCIGMAAENTSVRFAYQAVTELRSAGIDIVAGTDSIAGLKGTAIGPSLWMELDLYVRKCGMSAVDALKSATSVSAKRFRFDDRGTIETGKRADLVLVKGDATQNLECLWKDEGIVGVWKQGLRAV